MADTKTSALTALTGANTATGDKFVVLDVSDATQGAGGTLKTLTRAELLNMIRSNGVAFTITDGAAFEIDPANGEIQVVTLGANRTPAATNFAAGQCVLLGIDDGTAYTVTWTTVAPTWVKPGGTASAPTLATTGYTWILLWKVGTTIYGAEVGKP